MRDYLLQSSVCLHVNYADVPFQADRDETLAQRVTERVSTALERAGDAYAYLLPSGMQEYNKLKLQERGLLHADAQEAPFSVLYLRMDESLSVQTAVSDHVLVSCSIKGDQMQKALSEARQVRQQLAAVALLARDEEYGYLTVHPCDAGTGMRASALVHLPMLSLARQIDKTTKMLGENGVILRPFSGEIGKVTGGLFVIENRASLGKSAQERVQEVMESTEKVIGVERRCREAAREKGDEGVYDAVWRAYGIARYARKLTVIDARNLWSSLTLGADMGAFDMEENVLNDLWKLSQGMRPGEENEMGNLDVLRAQRVRFLLNGGN